MVVYNGTLARKIFATTTEKERAVILSNSAGYLTGLAIDAMSSVANVCNADHEVQLAHFHAEMDKIELSINALRKTTSDMTSVDVFVAWFDARLSAERVLEGVVSEITRVCGEAVKYTEMEIDAIAANFEMPTAPHPTEFKQSVGGRLARFTNAMIAASEGMASAFIPILLFSAIGWFLALTFMVVTTTMVTVGLPGWMQATAVVAGHTAISVADSSSGMIVAGAAGILGATAAHNTVSAYQKGKIIGYAIQMMMVVALFRHEATKRFLITAKMTGTGEAKIEAVNKILGVYDPQYTAWSHTAAMQTVAAAPMDAEQIQFLADWSTLNRGASIYDGDSPPALIAGTESVTKGGLVKAVSKPQPGEEAIRVMELYDPDREVRRNIYAMVTGDLIARQHTIIFDDKTTQYGETLRDPMGYRRTVANTIHFMTNNVGKVTTVGTALVTGGVVVPAIAGISAFVLQPYVAAYVPVLASGPLYDYYGELVPGPSATKDEQLAYSRKLLINDAIADQNLRIWHGSSERSPQMLLADERELDYATDRLRAVILNDEKRARERKARAGKGVMELTGADNVVTQARSLFDTLMGPGKPIPMRAVDEIRERKAVERAQAPRQDAPPEEEMRAQDKVFVDSRNILERMGIMRSEPQWYLDKQKK